MKEIGGHSTGKPGKLKPVIWSFEKYEFIKWFPDWHGIHFIKFDSKKTNMALIYEWHLVLGFWEIRKLARHILKLLSKRLIQ